MKPALITIGAFALITLWFVALPASAQHVAVRDANPLFASKTVYLNPDKPERKLSLDYADAVYWAGAITVIHQSRHKYELNPLFRGEEGEFATGRAVATTTAVWGAFKFFEYRYPEKRRLLFWAKISVGALHFAFVPHNHGVKQMPKLVER